ncbi:RDD family protein, partial [Kineococcus glutinatus]|uniref:RDD family protein n=1 Tax=Kineococcus glutinatus TaxID=1070872 RepID=UPI003CD0C2B3
APPRPAPEPPDDARPPGERLGLPAAGPGSVAGWGRRVLGIAVDWALASLVANAFLGEVLGRQAGPLVVFAVVHLVLVGTTGFTPGHLVAGVVVRGIDPAGRLGAVGVLRSAVRAVLLCLVIPAVVYDGDRRGLHDRAAGTVVLRR